MYSTSCSQVTPAKQVPKVRKLSYDKKLLGGCWETHPKSEKVTSYNKKLIGGSWEISSKSEKVTRYEQMCRVKLVPTLAKQ